MAISKPTTFRYAGVPGKPYVMVTIVPDGAPDPFVTLGDGSTNALHPIPLAKIVETLGGPKGKIIDPLSGQELFMDLSQWTVSDKGNTRVVMMWGFAPMHPIAASDRHLFDEWSLTHDQYSTMTDPVTVKIWDGSRPFELFK
ncbi:MAG: hypothetical protein JWO59_580 [Chloroflexi bacterium]|nr:hypothetical protein [Chloroflexota bacterium]